MDRGAWWATVHGVPKSQTWLSNNNSKALKKKKMLVNTIREFQNGEKKEKETGNKKMRESVRTKKTAQRK